MNDIIITISNNTTVSTLITCSISELLDYDGYVRLEINGVEYVDTPINNSATFNVSGLPSGFNLAIVTCKLDNAIVAYGVSRFTVSKVPTSLTVTNNGNITEGQNQIIRATVTPSGCTGLVIASLEETYYAEYINGTTGIATISIPNLPSTEYSFIVQYIGNDVYNASDSVTTTFTVTD